MLCNHTECKNRSVFGYCKLTACTNPQYNGSGTYTITCDFVPRADYDKVVRENEELKAKLESVIPKYNQQLADIISLKRENQKLISAWEVAVKDRENCIPCHNCKKFKYDKDDTGYCILSHGKCEPEWRGTQSAEQGKDEHETISPDKN